MQSLRELSQCVINNKFVLLVIPARRYLYHWYVNKVITFNYNNVGFKPNICIFPKIINARGFSLTNVFAKGKDRGGEKKKPKKSQVDLTQLSDVINVDEMISRMKREIENLKGNFIKNLTIRSNIGSIEQISVFHEDKEYQIQELAQVIRRPKLMVLTVSFPQVIPQIITALEKSGMNLNPQQDGTTLYIPIPKVTKEYRENLSKSAKVMFIKCRDNIKDVQNKYIKAAKGKTNVSQDLIRTAQNQIQAQANTFITEAEKILETKQKELLSSIE